MLIYGSVTILDVGTMIQKVNLHDSNICLCIPSSAIINFICLRVRSSGKTKLYRMPRNGRLDINLVATQYGLHTLESTFIGYVFVRGQGMTSELPPERKEFDQIFRYARLNAPGSYRRCTSSGGTGRSRRPIYFGR